jgi:hypothetical protein
VTKLRNGNGEEERKNEGIKGQLDGKGRKDVKKRGKIR